MVYFINAILEDYLKYTRQKLVFDKITEGKVNIIQRILKMSKGIVHGPDGAAALLGVNPSALRSKMKKLGIQYGRKR